MPISTTSATSTTPATTVSKQDITSITSPAEEESAITQTQSAEQVSVDAHNNLPAEEKQSLQSVEVALNQEHSQTSEQQQQSKAEETTANQVEQQSSEPLNNANNQPVPPKADKRVKTIPATMSSEQRPDEVERVLSKPVISNIDKKIILSDPVPSNTKEANKTQHTKDEVVVRQSNDKLIISNNIKSIPDAGKNSVPKFALLTADDRVRNAISFFNYGEIEKAEKELEDALVIEPNNRSARKLMRQLHQLPGDYFPQEEFFEYVLGPNETLLEVSEKFLNDPLAFYMLAKLNEIKDPVSLVPGKILKIPGNAEEFGDLVISPEKQKKQKLKDENLIKFERAKVYMEEQRFQEAIDLLTQFIGNNRFEQQKEAHKLLLLSYIKRASVLDNKGKTLEAQTLLETATNKLPNNKQLISQLKTLKNKREARRLYQVGLELNEMGNSHQALKTFTKVLDLNPGHSGAKKLIIDLKLTVVETSHKRAMVLYRRQELEQAIEIWNDILEIDPQYELAKQYRARALELKRKIERL